MDRIKILIIVVSVAGTIIMLTAASSILCYIAKRREWTIQETMCRSARRVTDAIKSPFFSLGFPKSGTTETGSLTALAPSSSYNINNNRRQRRRHQQQKRQNRSSRGMTRIAESSSPWTAAQNMAIEREIEFRKAEARRSQLTAINWRRYSGGNLCAAPQFTPSAGGLGGEKEEKEEAKSRRLKKQVFDLERGIELGSTESMKVTVSTASSNNKNWTANSSKGEGWGRTLFALGRR